MSFKQGTYQKTGENIKSKTTVFDSFILAYVSNLRIKHKVSAEQAFSLINQKINNNKNRKIQRFSYSISAAACIIFILNFYFTPFNSVQKFETLTGEILEIYLPDSSRVYLNEESKLTFNPQTWNKNRHVELLGEGFFEVIKGGNFEVETAKASVIVLGTSFKVQTECGNKKNRTICYTGSVKVIDKSHKKELTLQPGEAAGLHNNSIQHELVTLTEIPRWTKLCFNFENQSLVDVFNSIEKHFGVKINHPHLHNKFYTGAIKKNSLETVLDIICVSMGLEYKQLNNVITVNFKN